jgi:hypothetical protein
MSVYIVISQTARLAAVWARNRLTTQLLLSVSIIAYSALLLERNKKINSYYTKDENDRRNNIHEGPGDSD